MKPSPPVEFAPGFWRSPLPRRKDLAAFRSAGGQTVVDLTQRERPSVVRWCEEFGIRYIKQPTPYEGFDAISVAKSIIEHPGPTLVHCYHGRYRTGAVAQAIKELVGC